MNMNQIDQDIKLKSNSKKWLLIVLSLINPVLGFLYIGKGLLTLSYFIIFLAIRIFVYLGVGKIFFADELWPVVYIIGIIHAIYLGFQSSEASWNKYHTGLKFIFVLCVLWGMLRIFVFNFYTLPASSMTPNYPQESLVIVKRWGSGMLNSFFDLEYDLKQLKRGDVIVFNYPVDPSISFIKRVVALPHDRISFEQGQMLINGQPLILEAVPSMKGLHDYAFFKENNHGRVYLIQRNFDQVVTEYPFINSCELVQGTRQCIVPDNAIFVLGDNREESADSRYWGYVDSKAIIGKVVWSNAKQYEDVK